MIRSSKLAKNLGLTKSTVNRLAREGNIPCIALPSGHRRFDLEAVRQRLATEPTMTLMRPLSSTKPTFSK